MAESIDERELSLLEILEQAPDSSQRSLSKRLGIALGMTNLLLKKAVKRGWITIRNQASKPVYELTNQGMAARMGMLVDSIDSTLHFYSRARDLTRHALEKLKEAGVSRIAINGTSNVSEVIYLTARELGFDVACTVEGERHGQRWMDLRCAKPEDLKHNGCQAVVLDGMKSQGLQKQRALFSDVAIKVVSLRDDC